MPGNLLDVWSETHTRTPLRMRLGNHRDILMIDMCACVCACVLTILMSPNIVEWAMQEGYIMLTSTVGRISDRSKRDEDLRIYLKATFLFLSFKPEIMRYESISDSMRAISLMMVISSLETISD